MSLLSGYVLGEAEALIDIYLRSAIALHRRTLTINSRTDVMHPGYIVRRDKSTTIVVVQECLHTLTGSYTGAIGMPTRNPCYPKLWSLEVLSHRTRASACRRRILPPRLEPALHGLIFQNGQFHKSEMGGRK
jgi:hypothetical protein